MPERRPGVETSEVRRLLPLVLIAGLLGTAAPARAEIDPGTGQEFERTPVVVPMVFPVAPWMPWRDTFLACRSGCTRMHMGQDVLGPKMTPLVAAFDGRVTSLSRDGRSGTSIIISADRGRAAGWSAVYVHVNNDTPGTDDGKGSAQYAFPAGLEVGSRVAAGQLVAWMGDSGNAETTAPHLHFELRKGTGWGGVVYNPAPSLAAATRIATPRAAAPHPTGTLLRSPSGALFVLEGSNDAPKKRQATPAVLATHGRALTTAVPMTAAESLLYPTLPPLSPRDGTVVRDPAGTTWLVSGGTRAQATAAALAALGRVDPRVFALADADLARLPVAALPTTPFYSGALVRTGAGVHLVGADGALHLGTPDVNRSNGWVTRDVSVLPAGLELPPVGAPLALRDGTLAAVADGRVGVVSAGAFRRLHDARQVTAYGYTGRPRQAVPTAALAGLRTAALTAP